MRIVINKNLDQCFRDSFVQPSFTEGLPAAVLPCGLKDTSYQNTILSATNFLYVWWLVLAEVDFGSMASWGQKACGVQRLHTPPQNTHRRRAMNHGTSNFCSLNFSWTKNFIRSMRQCGASWVRINAFKYRGKVWAGSTHPARNERRLKNRPPPTWIEQKIQKLFP